MEIREFLKEWESDEPEINVQTSGSTGVPKRMRVEKCRMLASARMTCDFLGLKPGDTALLCMSLDYIAGKMMVVRAMERGLRLMTVPPSSHPLRSILDADGMLMEVDGSLSADVRPLPSSLDFVAMVPLQVYHSLETPEEQALLRQVRHLLIGGGAIDAALEQRLQDFPHAVWSSYGMTETLSHIALRRVNGAASSPWYQPLEGVRVWQMANGCLAIEAPAVCAVPLQTHDRVEMHPDGRRFRILGRVDNVIDSGGIKIQIEEVEHLLRPHLPCPFLITRRPDERLGEAVVLMVEQEVTPMSMGMEEQSWAQCEERLLAVCRRVLPRYWQPRMVIPVSRLPLTETGKPARAQAEAMALNANRP